MVRQTSLPRPTQNAMSETTTKARPISRPCFFITKPGRLNCPDSEHERDTIDSVANDHSTVLCDHDVNALATALEFVRQNLATEDAAAAIDVTRDLPGALGGNANRDGILAARHRIDHAEFDFNGGGWAAHGGWFTAGCRLRSTAWGRRGRLAASG